MVNVVSGATFYIYDENSSTSRKSPGWLALRTMEDEIDHLLSRAESKFCTPNGGRCTSKTIGLLVRRHIVAGEFHYIGKEAYPLDGRPRYLNDGRSRSPGCGG